MYKTPVALMKRKISLKILIKLQIQSVDFDMLTILHLQNLDQPPASNTEQNLTENLLLLPAILNFGSFRQQLKAYNRLASPPVGV